MFASAHSIDVSRQINATGVKGRAKHKRVFDYPMLAHVWAQQTQPDGRSPKGQMYFHGDTIYSYGSHFPIARFVLEGRAVLFNDEKRSQTTGRHQNAVRGALRGLSKVRVFSVPSIATNWGDTLHAVNLAHLIGKLNAYANRAAKAHIAMYHGCSNDTADIRVAGLEPLAREVRDYAEMFGLECPAHDLGAMETRIRDAFTRYNDPAKVAKRAASSASRMSRHWQVAARVAAFFEGVTDAKPNLHFVGYSAKRSIAEAFGVSPWQLEGRIDTLHRERMNARKPPKREVTAEQWQSGLGRADVFAYGYYHMQTMVRRVGDTLETSRGADCPFKHAIVAFLKAQECRATGTAWHRNGQQIRVGHFNVDAIDAAGNMRAGCHELKWEEMLRLAIREVPQLVKPSFGLPALLDM